MWREYSMLKKKLHCEKFILFAIAARSRCSKVGIGLNLSHEKITSSYLFWAANSFIFFLWNQSLTMRLNLRWRYFVPCRSVYCALRCYSGGLLFTSLYKYVFFSHFISHVELVTYHRTAKDINSLNYFSFFVLRCPHLNTEKARAPTPLPSTPHQRSIYGEKM